MKTARSACTSAFVELVEQAGDLGASDLHLFAGLRPVVRVDGALGELDPPALDTARVDAMVAELSDRDRGQGASIDLALSLDDDLRLRVHIYDSVRGLAIAVRLLPARIPTIDECGLPPEVADLSHVERGLVVICGVTGSGKSTTIAALVEQARADRALHVVTIEDPIEYLYDSGHGIVSQREIGRHAPGFAAALRDALRADPDVVVVGELRDAESIELALVAAETGHVVFTSVHAGSTAGAVDRLVHALPSSRWDCVRAQIAAVLEGAVYQELLPLPNRPGRVVASEVLRATPAVRQLIREGKSHQLLSVIEVSRDAGMRSFADSMARLRG